jgi:hypothetical protein
MSPRGDVLARLAVLVAVDAARRPLSWRLCEACRQLLGAERAAITLNNSGRDRVTLASTDALMARIEDVQDVLGEGPGWDAYASGRLVSATMTAENRWPRFSDEIREFGGASTLFAVPMHPSTLVLGVLTFLRTPEQAPDTDLDTAQFLSDAVGAALLRDPEAYAGYGAGGPWSERVVIHQATGIVCAQLRISVEDALALLKAHAYAHEMNLHEVAQLVIDRQIDFRIGD